MNTYAAPSPLAGALSPALPVESTPRLVDARAGRDRPHSLLRLILGSMLGLLAYFAGSWLENRFAFSILEIQTVAAFATGALLGGWGIAGFGTAHLALGLSGAGLAQHLSHLGIYLPAALSASLLRPWIEAHPRDVGRYLRTLATAVVAALGVALVGSGLLLADHFGSAVFLWTASNLTSLVLVAPVIVALLGSRRRGMAQPGPRLNSRQGWIVATSLVAIIGLGLLGMAFSEAMESLPIARYQGLTLLFLAPCVVAALVGGFRVAMLTASAAGLGYLLTEAILGPSSHGDFVLAYSQPLLFAAVSGAVASRHQKLFQLSSRLRESRRQLARHEERTAQALNAAIAARDPQTSEHLRRVGSYSVAVAKRLGLEGRDLEVMRIGARLHDLGKLGIPDQILAKNGDLSPAEERLIRLHPEIGANILRGLGSLQEAVPLVYQHQERWDGAGYPNALKRDEICLGARIIAVVDAFDAMVSDRPYRPALTLWAAIRELRSEAGHQFDPQVVEAFLATLADHPWPGRPD